MPKIATREKVEVVVYNEYGEILMLEPSKKYGWWAIPGGGVDAGETDEQACLRETLEEAGCRIENIESLHYTYEFDGQWSNRPTRKITRYYKAKFVDLDISLYDSAGDGRIPHWKSAKEAILLMGNTVFDRHRKQVVHMTSQSLYVR